MLLYGNDVIAWAASLRRPEDRGKLLCIERSASLGVRAIILEKGEKTELGRLALGELEVRIENRRDKLCRLPQSATARAKHRLVGVLYVGVEGEGFGVH